MPPGICVLSVEDDAGIFQLIKRTLLPLEVDLHHASTGFQALDMIHTLQPALIVLDIALPDMHGWEILEQAKQIESRLPLILVLTASHEPANRVIGHLHAVNRYLFKPFTPAELRQCVSDLLEIT